MNLIDEIEAAVKRVEQAPRCDCFDDGEIHKFSCEEFSSSRALERMATKENMAKLLRVVRIAMKQQETIYYGMSEWQVEASERMKEALEDLKWGLRVSLIESAKEAEMNLQMIERYLKVRTALAVLITAIETKWKKTTPPKELIEPLRLAKELLGE